MGKLGNIIVLNRYHCDDPNAIYIGRGSPLGNPFTVEQHGRDRAIRFYEPWLEQQIGLGIAPVIDELDRIANAVLAGRDVKLKCFCKPKPCHGDHIKYVVNKVIAEMKP
jgi:hypothetical protein